MLGYKPSPESARLVRTIVACWAALLLVAYFWPGQRVVERMELYLIDWRFGVRGPEQPDPRLVIVAVDEPSINARGRWPWPRNEMAQLIRKLQAIGAERVIFDVFFTEADESTHGAAQDAELVKATRAFGEVHHAGFTYDPKPGEQLRPLSPEAVARAWDTLAIDRPTGLEAASEVFQPRGLVMPLPELASAARSVGVMNVLDSGDGVFRHILPVLEYQGHVFPSLALAVACDVMGVAPQEVRVRPGAAVALGDKAGIPLDVDGRMMVNFAGGRNTYPRLSAAEVLAAQAGSAVGAKLAGRIVLVGVTAPGLEDLRPSPFDAVYNGVETQANALDTMLNSKGLRRLAPVYTALFIVLAGAVFAVLLVRTSTPVLCVSALAGASGYVACGVYLFIYSRLIIDLLLPAIGLAGFFVIVLLVRLLGEERRRRQAQETLAVFIPQPLVDRLVTDEAIDTMRGERRVITVLFADLRGFTSASEGVPPEATVELLNRYFTFMHDVIWANEGTLDKYIGDEIMAFFNAPVLQPDHARRAVRTALEMQREIQRRHDEWAFLGMPELAAGIGISTGLAVIGYVGSAARMQYTAIGHHVNLASRLQALSKELGQRILISAATYAELGDEFEIRAQGMFDIRGVGEKVGLYSVLGPKGHPEYLTRPSIF